MFPKRFPVLAGIRRFIVERRHVTVEGNEAAVHVAHQTHYVKTLANFIGSAIWGKADRSGGE